MSDVPDGARQHWSRDELDAIVDDYFEMLAAELRGDSFNKAEHRRRLLPRLNGRSGPSVEFKHRNISAVLAAIGAPHIHGYVPALNFQRAIVPVVEAALQRTGIRWDVMEAHEHHIGAVAGGRTGALELVAPPVAPAIPKSMRDALQRVHARAGRLIDWAAREQRNRALGRVGEELVLESERERLRRAGREDLARQVRHVAVEEGDGLGYDIASFDPEGAPKLIEVKATRAGVATPFLVSRNEVQFSAENPRTFVLTRVFGLIERPQAFELRGPLERTCALDPATYVGRVA
ncbi:MAG: DUF3883 domain-containing protein [Phycisphaerales bacterium]